MMGGISHLCLLGSTKPTHVLTALQKMLSTSENDRNTPWWSWGHCVEWACCRLWRFDGKGLLMMFPFPKQVGYLWNRFEPSPNTETGHCWHGGLSNLHQVQWSRCGGSCGGWRAGEGWRGGWWGPDGFEGPKLGLWRGMWGAAKLWEFWGLMFEDGGLIHFHGSYAS